MITFASSFHQGLHRLKPKQQMPNPPHFTVKFYAKELVGDPVNSHLLGIKEIWHFFLLNFHQHPGEGVVICPHLQPSEKNNEGSSENFTCCAD